MKEKKNQTSEKAAPAFQVTTTAKEVRTTLPSTDPVFTAFLKQGDANSKWNRRHSFDDNGGGYAGL